MKKKNRKTCTFLFKGALLATLFFGFLNIGVIQVHATCAYGQDDAGDCLPGPTTNATPATTNGTPAITNSTPAITNSTPTTQTCTNGYDDAGNCYTAPTTNCGMTAGSLQNPLNACNLSQLLVEILGYVTYLGSIFLVLALVYVGFLFVMAQGNPEAVSKARSALLWTAIGGLLLLGASAIALVISSTVQAL